MIKKKIFKREETPYHPGKYIIQINHDNFFLKNTEGSFIVICARLMNLSYPDFLRMCRDCFGAEIIGKNSIYPYPLFKGSKELDALIDNLNARANLVLWERENPDYEEHARFVKEHSPDYYEEALKVNASN